MRIRVVRDPVNRVRHTFEPAGDDLVNHCCLERGGTLPAHLHPQQTETWSVREGTVRFRLGDEERTIGREDGEIVVAPGTVHAVANDSDRDAQLRCVIAPALRRQSFVEESAAAAKEGLFTARGRPRGLHGARWAASFLERYRDETVLLSPPAIVQRALIALLARDA